MGKVILGKRDGHPGASVEEHLRWVRNELRPPVTVPESVRYVLFAFEDALMLIQKHEEASGAGKEGEMEESKLEPYRGAHPCICGHEAELARLMVQLAEAKRDML